MKRAASIFLIAFLFSACTGMGAARQSDVQKIRQGMTESEVVDVLGRPYDINRSNYGDYTTAQFVYNSANLSYERYYVYFRNGRVTSTQY